MAPRTDLSKYDASQRELTALDSLIKAKAQQRQPVVEKETVEKARHGKSLYEVVSDRDTTRLLFISQDESLLNQTQQSLDGYLDLSDVFDEVHIVILRPGIPAKFPVLRVASNVWLYTATSSNWWGTPFAAMELIKEQLEFADGFRPDLIVARDPFESALVAHMVARKYGRAAQIHILEDINDPNVVRRMHHPRLRKLVAKYLMRQFLSVRTATDTIATIIRHHYPNIPDVATLPRFNNYESYKHARVNVNIKDRYRQYSFIMLYFGSLTHNSTVHQVIDAVQQPLQNPRAGLVIVGDGAARAEFQKRADLLGIGKQVVFERSAEDMIGYLKTADLLIVTDTDAEAEEVVIKGAAAGIPIVTTATPQRTDLFTDLESAMIVQPGNVDAIAQRINVLLNDYQFRMSMCEKALGVVVTRLHEDPIAYRRAYRRSVEEGLFAGQVTATDEISDQADATITTSV